MEDKSTPCKAFLGEGMINWELIWKEFLHRIMFKNMPMPEQFMIIEELVEEQIAKGSKPKSKGEK